MKQQENQHLCGGILPNLPQLIKNLPRNLVPWFPILFWTLERLDKTIQPFHCIQGGLVPCVIVEQRKAPADTTANTWIYLAGSPYQDSNHKGLAQQVASLHFTTKISGTKNTTFIKNYRLVSSYFLVGRLTACLNI